MQVDSEDKKPLILDIKNPPKVELPMVSWLINF
jgi:hypothetical protein